MSLPPALLQLRSATAEAHARMEALPRMGVVRGESVTLADYIELLALFYGYHEPVERALSASPVWARHGFDFARRRKLDQLAADLRFFGWSEQEIAALPRAAAPALPTAAAALGCLYVLEGATLGAQLLARHVAARLNLSPERGAAFFTGYGAAVGPMWRECCALLVAHCGPDQIDPELVAAANATFAGMADWLSQERAAPGSAGHRLSAAQAAPAACSRQRRGQSVVGGAVLAEDRAGERAAEPLMQ